MRKHYAAIAAALTAAAFATTALTVPTTGDRLEARGHDHRASSILQARACNGLAMADAPAVVDWLVAQHDYDRSDAQLAVAGC